MCDETNTGNQGNVVKSIEVRGAKVHNLNDLDVSIPLNQLVAIAGVSGSGKSSLALGVLYAEGSRRYLDALSTYTRRRMTQAGRPQVDSIHFLPPALALRQRPGSGGVRSTFGTSTELLNVLRLMFSRLAWHRCPNGHYHRPTMAVAAEIPIYCEVCGELIEPPSAEELAFNSVGACPTCQGTGIVREVDDGTLVPDESLTIDEGAVVPWRTFGFNVQPYIVREFGVRTNVPFRDLTEHEREIVFNGPAEKKHITLTSVKGVHQLDFTFRNARLTVTKELERANDEKRLTKVGKFLIERVCPDCKGSRLNETARAPRIDDHDLAQVTAWSLEDILAWSLQVPSFVSDDMELMAQTLSDTLREMGERLTELGLGYLTLDRSSASLSTGERQRAQLARAVRNETTGVLYVLDEPSTGLHPANIEGLIGVMRDLLANGNSVVFVDHDVRVLRAADYFIEMGPGAGSRGGNILSQGTPEQIEQDRHSRIAGFLAGNEDVVIRDRRPLPDDNGVEDDGDHAWLCMETSAIHTVHPLTVSIPQGRMTAVSGVSGSGKTTMILESLIPALQAKCDGKALPRHVKSIETAGITRVRLVDSTPIGINVRSTVATYTNIMDSLRREFAATREAKERHLNLSAFSYNTGSLRCPQCDGTDQVSLDVQFLPDIIITCPVCHGSRYRSEADDVKLVTPSRPEGVSLPQVLDLEIDEALDVFNAQFRRIRASLQTLSDLGLGYLKLGEDTPSLSGGEAQRLKLSNDLGKRQDNTLFVLDEPTTGLHPLDVRTLIRVLQRLIEAQGTVVFIEHDLDMIANADYVIDMGPGGGNQGGRIIATGTPYEIVGNSASITGTYLSEVLT